MPLRHPIGPALLLLTAIAALSSCAHFDGAATGGAVSAGRVSSPASVADGALPERTGGEVAQTGFEVDEEVQQIAQAESNPVPPAPAGGQMNVPDAAGHSPTQPAALTLADLEQMAMQANPTLQQLAAVVEKARGIRQQVGLYPNPTIAYTGNEMGADGTAGQQGGIISQTFVTGDKLKLNRGVIDWNIEALSWEYQAQQYRVQNDVRLRYFDVLGAQRRIRIAEDLLAVADAGLNTAKEAFDAGQGTRPDVLQAQVDLGEVRIDLQNARIDYEAAWRRLSAVLGRPGLEPTLLAGDLEDHVAVHDWDVTYQQLLENSPEMQAALADIQQARVAIRRQEVQPLPNLLTQAGVVHNNASGEELASVQVGITLPVFNRNQGNIATARAELYRATRDLERLRLDLKNRLAAALRDLRQARQQVQRYQQDIIPTARENLELTEGGYRQGQFNFLRVLTARRTYFETNLKYVESLIALRKADVIVSGLLLTGGLNDVADFSSGFNGAGTRGQALSQQ